MAGPNVSVSFEIKGVDSSKSAVRSAQDGMRSLAGAGKAAGDAAAGGAAKAIEPTKQLQQKASQAGAAFSGLASTLGASEGPLGVVARSVTATGAALNFLPGAAGLATAAVAGVGVAVYALTQYLNEGAAAVRLFGGQGVVDLAKTLNLSRQSAAELTGTLRQLETEGVRPTDDALKLVAKNAKALGQEPKEALVAYLAALKAGGPALDDFQRKFGNIGVRSEATLARDLGLRRELISSLKAEDEARQSIAGAQKAVQDQEANVAAAQARADAARATFARASVTDRLSGAGKELNVAQQILAHEKSKQDGLVAELKTREAIGGVILDAGRVNAELGRKAAETNATTQRDLAEIGAAEALGQTAKSASVRLQATLTAITDRQALLTKDIAVASETVRVKTAVIADLEKAIHENVKMTADDKAKISDELSKAKVDLTNAQKAEHDAAAQKAVLDKQARDAKKSAYQEAKAAADALRSAELSGLKSAVDLDAFKQRSAAQALDTAERLARAEAATQSANTARTRAGAAERFAISLGLEAKLAGLRQAAATDAVAKDRARSDALAGLAQRDSAIQTSFLERRAAALHAEGRDEEAENLQRAAAEKTLALAQEEAIRKHALAIADAKLILEPARRAEAVALADKERGIAIEEALAARQIAATEAVARGLDARVRTFEAFGSAIEKAGSLAGGKFAAGMGAASRAAGLLGKHWDNLKAGAGDLISASGAVAAAGIDGTTGQAAVLAGFETAAALASFAFGDLKGAALHGASAAAYAAVAGMSAAGLIGGSSSSGSISTGGGSTSVQAGGGQQGGGGNTVINFTGGFVFGTAQQVAQGIVKTTKTLDKTGFQRMKAA